MWWLDLVGLGQKQESNVENDPFADYIYVPARKFKILKRKQTNIDFFLVKFEHYKVWLIDNDDEDCVICDKRMHEGCWWGRR